MSIPFRVEADDVSRLNDVQLTQLLKALLHAEAFQFEIAQNRVEVALNITIGDGGEDGWISWDDGPDKTDFIPNRKSLFQVKATKLTPSACGKEVVGSDGAVKSRIDEVLKDGGSYIIFTTQGLNGKQKREREKSIRKALSDAGAEYEKTCELWFYDASLISQWVNQYASVVVLVRHWIGSPMVQGLKTFDRWKQNESLRSFEFVEVPSRRDCIEDLKHQLAHPRKCFRIQGLSGLGKTRTVLQVFEEDEALRPLVVYFDASQPSGIDGLVSDWVGQQFRVILIVDNCDYHLHQRLVSEVTSQDSLISLVTLDYSYNQFGAPTQCINLQQMSAAELIQILEPAYKERLQDIERIANFAQGFPQMAVLLAEARLNEDPRIGELTEDQLAEKLLWARGEPQNNQYLDILQVCALFDSFGIEGNKENQLEFIAELAGIDAEVVYACVQKFTDRGIIDRRGRFGQVVPKPLAIRLAGQWWTKTRAKRQEQVISMIPDEMITVFCDQIACMDYHADVKQLTENLCGDQGAFGQAEVILSDRGSRLFRAFVEVNPEVTASTLFDVLSGLSYDELLAIEGDTRRNLVWALEKLCFRDSQFEQAAWCTLLLAVAENETWSNNASGTFSQLFRVNLSGTEAPPQKRIELLNQALSLSEEKADMVLLDAVEEGIDTRGGSRTVGAEYQGTKPPLEEWRPKIWQEIFDYWDQLFTILLKMLNRGDAQREKSISLIGNSIRGLVARGRLSMLDRAVTEVLNLRGRHWPEATDSINSCLEFEGDKLPQQARDQLNLWLDRLNPDNGSIEEKLKIIVVDAVLDYRKGDDGDYHDLGAEKAKALAAELGKVPDQLEMYIPLLSEGIQRQSFIFGKELIGNCPDYMAITEGALKGLANSENPSPQFALGLLSGIYDHSKASWEKVVSQIESTDKVSSFYPDFITTGAIRKEHWATLNRLIEKGVVSHRSIGANAVPLKRANTAEPSEVGDFSKRLSSMGKSGSWAALNVMHAFCYGDEEFFEATRDCLREIVTKVPLGDGKNRHTQMDIYHWDRLIRKLLNDADERILESFGRQVSEGAKAGYNYGDLWSYVKPLFLEMMEKYYNTLWPIFADAIIESSGIEKYGLKSLFDRENGFDSYTPSVFSVIPIEQVVEWCNKNLESAPVFVASCLNIFEDKEGRKCPSEIFVEILKQYGNKKVVRNQLFANLGSRSWSGSLVPYLEQEKAALMPLRTNGNVNVRSWVGQYLKSVERQIEKESSRDEEQHLGHF